MALPDRGRLGSLFELQFPQPLGQYGSYADAQQAVDYLADHQFPVENLCIVGTDLRQVERVTGRKDWGTVINSGLSNGLMIGLIFGVMALIFYPPETNFFTLTAVAILAAAVISIIFGVIGRALSRGKRDFTSVTQTIATRYEVLCEHKVAMQARELLAEMPGARGTFFS